VHHPPDDAIDVQPWNRPGAVRRDCDAHRAQLLHLLSLAAFWLCLLLPCTVGLTGLVGVGIAFTVWRMARADLGQMERGLMDPEGWEATKKAKHLAVGSVALACLLVLTVGAVVYVHYVVAPILLSHR
jgi:hypothetical protein